MSLVRVCEIAEKVVDHMNILHDEKDFLNLVKELSKDFEELHVLEEKMVEKQRQIERELFDDMIKEFVVHILPTNSKIALAVLEDSTRTGLDTEALQAKYPEFKKFKDQYVKQRI